MFKGILEDKETMTALQRVGIVVLMLLTLIVGMKIGLDLNRSLVTKKCTQGKPLFINGVEYTCRKT